MNAPRRPFATLASIGLLIAASLMAYAFYGGAAGEPPAAMTIEKPDSSVGKADFQPSVAIDAQQINVRGNAAVEWSVEGSEEHRGNTREKVMAPAPQQRSPLSPSLQSDLDLLGPDTDFEETVRGFATEALDPVWSRETETQILNVMAMAGALNVAEVELHCRSLTCRLRMSNARFDPRSEYPNFAALVDSLGLEVIWLWMAPDQFGNRVGMAYLRAKNQR